MASEASLPTSAILIAVGGTGAKVAEAIVHATAAGLGPAQLLVGFIDQDGSNGNTGRARRVVESYAQARSRLRGDGAPHRLDPGSALLRPDIRLLLPDRPIWTPHPDASTTLHRVLGQQDPVDSALFDLLFEAGEDEQQMHLGGGYQARPNVGSLAIALASEEVANPFVAALREAMKKAASGPPVRLLLTGSLFGGTGAGGFPTLARLFKPKPGEVPVGKFALGGALMLPYFHFPSPDEGANFARSEQFLVQTRAALRYYYRLQTQEQLPFDHLLLTGWFPTFAVETRAFYDREQENDAMPPELVAALAAARFLSGADAPAGQSAIMTSTRARADGLEWTDLPSGDDGLAPFRELGRALRFAIAFQYWSRFGRSEGEKRKRFGVIAPKRHAFYKTQGLNSIDWDMAPPQAEIEALAATGLDLIEWARQMQSSASLQSMAFNLWDVEGFNPEGDGAAYTTSFDRAVRVPAAVAAPAPAEDLAADLADRPGPDAAKGLGRMIERIYASTAIAGDAS